VYAAAPSVRTLGVEFVRIAPDGVVGQLKYTPALSTTHFLAPVIGTATANATPVNVGKRRVVVDVAIHDDDGRLCARVIQTVHLHFPPQG